MKKINHKELKQFIKKSHATKIPLFIWGTMGIGKSTVVRQTAEELKMDFIDVRISQLDPSDLRGLPKTDGEVTKWLVPNWLPRDKNSKGVLFFDELNLAPPSVQSACYQLILDRRLGDYELPEHWVIISAGNRLEDKANVFDMPSPLANRFVHVELSVPTYAEWTQWATDGRGIDSRIVSFINFKPSSLFNFNPKNKDKAFSTPRSWDFCSSLIEGEEYSKNSEFLDTLISSAVGEAVSTEFTAFLKLQRKVKAEDIIKDPSKIKDIEEIDLKYALLSSIAEYLKAHKSKDTVESIVTITNQLDAEFGILLFRLSRSTERGTFDKYIFEVKNGKETVTKYAPYLMVS